VLAATQHNESDIMTPAYPTQSDEYTPSCDAVTIPTPNNTISGIEDAIKKGVLTSSPTLNLLPAVTRNHALKSEA
jgi:hypothetical protein